MPSAYLLQPIVLNPAKEQFEFYSKQTEAIAISPSDPDNTEPAADNADEQVEPLKNYCRACDSKLSQSTTADPPHPTDTCEICDVSYRRPTSFGIMVYQ
ncbi:unnamed protein product [Schistocephalus solidus]|uniref:Uncharacterized protein n=1 Tax=Schistocephalus solidus TaxID=70667 RepID=A0A183TSR8_SCHSO|nr:unnamed protein product [Schistocephalus solidus]